MSATKKDKKTAAKNEKPEGQKVVDAIKKAEFKHYKIEDVNPAAYNPREITDAAFEGLKESIKKFGLVDPLIVNVRNGQNVLVGGHQRLKAASSLGFKTVPVVEVDLSPAEEKALNVTLNNPKIAGSYNETLSELLAEIKVDLGDDFLKDLKLDELAPEPLTGGGEDRSEEGSGYVEQYGVIVICKDTIHQEQVYNDLVAQGYNCKVVVT